MNTETVVQSFLYSRLSRGLKAESVEWYKRYLRKFVEFSPEWSLEPEVIEEFVATVVPPECDESRHNYYSAVRALYRYYCRRNRLANPTDFLDPPVKRKKVKQTLSAAEMLTLLTRATRLRDLAILSLFIDCGARAGEAATLQYWNIHDTYIKVTGKSGEREIPISEETRQRLLALAPVNDRDGFVFVGQRGPLTRSGFYKVIRKYMEIAGIKKPKLGPHRIRHGFGKNYVVNGGDTRSLQKIMGHSNITTTEEYCELSDEEVREKHHRFTPLRSTHAAAQSNMFGSPNALQEAEDILKQKNEQ